MKTPDSAADITARQSNLFRLIDLGHMFESVSAGVMLLDDSGRIVYLNRAQCEMDESNQQELLGASYADLYPKQADNSILIANVLADGEEFNECAIMYQNPDGTVIHSLFSGYPIVSQGRLHGLICFAQKFGPSIIPETIRTAGPSKAPSTAQVVTIIGRHPRMLRAISIARTAAATPSPIMLCGETGTGKEVFARSIHSWSPLSGKPYVAVNCAAIPDTLAESILFGTTKGSFTGATESPGLFEQANGDILFLDEIDSMPLELQPKLLRVIQEMKVRRVGSSVEKNISVKIITAAGTSAENILESKRLRADLYYRLGVNIIELPPLRERLSDLPELINHFLLKLNYKLGQRFKGVAPEVLRTFHEYHWPGNIRELEHAIESCMNSSLGQFWITDKMLPSHFFRATGENSGSANANGHNDRRSAEDAASSSPPSTKAVRSDEKGDAAAAPNIFDIKNIKDISDDSERQLLLTALRKTYGNITLAAKDLGISRQLMHYKMRKFKLSKADGRNG